MDRLRMRMALQAQNLAQGTHGKAWYQVRNAQDRTVINIYDEIGDFFGLSAGEFVTDLQAINTPTIELHINSPGGIVFDGIAIYNALRQHPANVHVIVDSIAASIASVIAMAGDRIEMAHGSQMMIHDAHGACIGNAADMTEMAALLAKQSDNIANIYANRAGGEVADWRQRMTDTTFYLAQEAVDAGLADGVLGDDAELGMPMAAAWRPDMLNHVPVIANRALDAWFRHVESKASAVHHTAVDNSAWDGPGAERNMPNDAATLKYCHAWSDPDGDPDNKSSYKFPHHRTKGGPANLAACRNGLARLPGADIDDKAAVEAHLRAHLSDGSTEDHHHERVEDKADRLDWDPEAFKRAVKEGMS
jgi:ATP-dependent protease ClpP protease subunit